MLTAEIVPESVEADHSSTFQYVTVQQQYHAVNHSCKAQLAGDVA